MADLFLDVPAEDFSAHLKNLNGSMAMSFDHVLKMVLTVASAALVVMAADARSETATQATTNSGAIMDTVDLRPIFKKWGLNVRSQGERNTCSVFTVTDALEYALAQKDHEGTRLSVEYLNWAAGQATGKPRDGGFFSDIWKGFSNYGICPQDDLPYSATFDANIHPDESAARHAQSVRNAGLRLHWIKPWDPTHGVSDEQLDEIKNTLRKQWPVCGGFLWPKKTIWSDKNILEIAPRDGVRDGHSVLLVGFRDDPAQAGGGVFLFQNTSRANRDGYMTYEYAKTYMNDAIWVDSPMPATMSADKHEAQSRRDILGVFGSAPVGRNRRASSNEQPGWNSENMDMTWLQPGERLEMPLLEGPGVITHMWFTSHAGWVGELNSLSMRIYWDGQKEPGVEVPLGDFFAAGYGKPAVVESFPVQVSSTGALSCYWRMPFHKSARIVITNDNPNRGTGLYWQVDWTQVKEVPEDSPYFCACYRQEYPAEMNRDYTIAELSGRGQYIGSVMSLTMAQDGWFGEGDDFFYIDGEEIPSLQGTGSEDYFNDAWGFRPRSSHWFGSPKWQGDRAGDSGIAYRWHIQDAVNFSKSLKVAIEHKGNRDIDTDGFFIERPDFISSVAFWYQEGEPKLFAHLSGWNERRVPWDDRLLVRSFRSVQTTGDARVKVDTAGLFGARPTLLWKNKTPGAVMTMPLEMENAGQYAIRLIAASGAHYGMYDVKIDGTKIHAVDFGSAEDGEMDVLLGTHELAAGKHVLSFCASDAAHVGPMAVEMIRFLKLPPEAKRDIRIHHEAHFVRLGIGRAVYAYRLAYDRVPDSLQALVDAGLMSARYLNDENNLPLQCHREGDYLVVESKNHEAWTHRWEGLDARR
ncbi:MAG TPA: DUF2961 domain-containing protein [Tepidisphaeraceae bacterium]|jgi:hypothetical protein|nr:DUF2961 domain-containing protein [Tepidisphaeraceae bacterium]